MKTYKVVQNFLNVKKDMVAIESAKGYVIKFENGDWIGLPKSVVEGMKDFFEIAVPVRRDPELKVYRLHLRIECEDGEISEAVVEGFTEAKTV